MVDEIPPWNTEIVLKFRPQNPALEHCVHDSICTFLVTFHFS